MTKQMHMINQKKFAIAALYLDKKAFIVYVAYLESKISIYSACEAPITLFLAKKITVCKKYADCLDVFSKKSVAVLFNWLNINEHAINFELDR